MYTKTEKVIMWLTTFDFMSYKKAKFIIDQFDDLEELFDHISNYKSVLSKMFSAFEINELILENNFSYIDNVIRNYDELDIEIVTIRSEKYSNLLKEIDSPPILLYCKGDTNLLKSTCLGVVGTRRATKYGKDMCDKFVKDIACQNITIVSGLAEGIDTCAHKATLDVHGKTIAVLGGGFDHIYPPDHQSLAYEIANKGLLISEQRPKKLSSKYLFPLRNRIIAGISDGTLITEASIKSGTIHTKDFALDYGKIVYAVPGNIDSFNSELTNEVIKTGQGQCVTSGKDILDELNFDSEVGENVLVDLSPDEQKIVSLLRKGMQNIDYLTKNCDLDINNFNSCLTMLEIKGIISRLAGGNVALN